MSADRPSQPEQRTETNETHLSTAQERLHIVFGIASKEPIRPQDVRGLDPSSLYQQLSGRYDMLTASEATQAIVELQEQDDGTTSDDGEPLFTVHGMMEKIYAGSLTRAEANRVDLRVVDAYLAGAYGDTEAAGYSADVRNVLSQLRDSEE